MPDKYVPKAPPEVYEEAIRALSSELCKQLHASTAVFDRDACNMAEAIVSGVSVRSAMLAYFAFPTENPASPT